jgi:hypothetical protein
MRGAFTNTLENFSRRIATLHLAADVLVVHPGWFDHTLRREDVENGTLRPAIDIDCDVDLYRSTRDALEFMFAHRLIRPGTLLGYDDWGDTELWTAGESRAHREVTDRYGAKTTQLWSWGEPPLIRTLFRVDSVSATAP